MVVMFMVMVMLVLMLVLMLMMVFVLMTAARMSMFVVMMMFVCHNYFNFSILQFLNFSISQSLNSAAKVRRSFRNSVAKCSSKNLFEIFGTFGNNQYLCACLFYLWIILTTKNDSYASINQNG